MDCLELEQRVIQIFRADSVFHYAGAEYHVKCVDKPRPSASGGECKTDIYILAEGADFKSLELKISVKTSDSNEFQGNKLTAKDAEAYFGENWKEIVRAAAAPLKDKFENQPLIFADKKGKTNANSITLGWKLEIASKERTLCSKIPLTLTEVRDFVYKGTNQPEARKNARVCGRIVENSGVADYILFADHDSLNTPEDVLKVLKKIDDYQPPEIYLIFTANNYRTREDKADGPRSLAVYIEWGVENGKLAPHFVYNDPLSKTGQNDMKPILLKALGSLGKQHPDEFLKDDVSEKCKMHWR